MRAFYALAMTMVIVAYSTGEADFSEDADSFLRHGAPRWPLQLAVLSRWLAGTIIEELHDLPAMEAPEVANAHPSPLVTSVTAQVTKSGVEDQGKNSRQEATHLTRRENSSMPSSHNVPR